MGNIANIDMSIRQWQKSTLETNKQTHFQSWIVLGSKGKILQLHEICYLWGLSFYAIFMGKEMKIEFDIVLF